MIVPGKYAVKYSVNTDGSYKLENFGPYDKQEYYSGNYVFGYIIVDGIDELDGFKNALQEIENRSNSFRKFVDGFIKQNNAQQ